MPSPAALIRAAFNLFDSPLLSAPKNSRPEGRHFYGGAEGIEEIMERLGRSLADGAHPRRI